jgi:hypothetical protein
MWKVQTILAELMLRLFSFCKAVIKRIMQTQFISNRDRENARVKLVEVYLTFYDKNYNRMTNWERVFSIRLRQKLRRYGEKARFSDAQIERIQDIIEKYGSEP